MHHTMSRSCVVAVVISTFATIVVVVVLLSSSADKNIWCVGGAVPWGGKNYNDTTTKNVSEVTVVNATNQEEVWQRLYGHESVGIPKYRVGDCVRISKAKRQFKKGYMANWTEELFTIVDAHRSEPPVYRLTDWHGERLVGTFYEPELQKVVVSKDKTYRIEEILRWRNKRREAFVKWVGWPASFNSWIDAKTLVNYSK